MKFSEITLHNIYLNHRVPFPQLVKTDLKRVDIPPFFWCLNKNLDSVNTVAISEQDFSPFSTRNLCTD